MGFGSRSVRRPVPVLLAGALVWMAGCASFDVRSDWDSTVDFSGFQRFHWVEPPRHEDADPFADNDLLRKRVRLAVFRTLEERGYRPVGSAEEADFLVTWDVTLEERLRVSGGHLGGYYSGPRYPFRSGYSGYAGAGGRSTVRSDQDSTLLIDFLEARTNQLIWRGWANEVVGTRDRVRDLEEVEQGVRQILDAFPPSGSGS
jgi:hypothetical protein